MNAQSADGPFTHAVTSLGFEATLELIARRCANEAARRLVLALRPAADREAIAGSLAAIGEYRAIRDIHGDVSMADVGYRDAVERASGQGASLETDELLRVAAGERTAAELKRQLTVDPQAYPLMARLAERLAPHLEVVGSIERAIDTDGNVRDDASPVLLSLRRRIQRARGSLRARSEKTAASHGGDSYATVLGSRYVLLVPRSELRQRGGLVHSTSHSGGSVYYEPLDLVERNNELETLVIDEGAEVARIVRELGDRVRDAAREILGNVDVIVEADALRAKATFAREFDCVSPGVSATGEIRLRAARHPQLALSLGAAGAEVVPLDLRVGEEAARVMVITGPNAGGKTVALKTLGMAVLLFQSGIQVPCAEGTELPVFERLMVDIGDEQSIEASLSTFTSHLKHLDGMCRWADGGALCLIDEIGDGTDPDEGAALAVAVLESLISSGAAVVATTHYGRIKTFALHTPGVANASMAFEDAEGRPLYRLLQGLAGRSRGLETARRVGFAPEVLESAERYLGADAFRLEAILSDLEASHLALELERERLARQSAALESVIGRYTERAAQFDLSKREADRRAGQEAEEFLLRTRREVESIVREIRESQARREVLRGTREKLNRLLEAARKRRVPPPASQSESERRAGKVAVGDRVALNPTGQPAGRVIAVENGSVTVEINNKRIKLKVEALYEAPLEEKGPPNGVTYDVQVEPLSSTTLDVRGSRREEALEAVNRFVDRAVLSGVQEITIIHGVGEGILARSIRELLTFDDRVTGVRYGELGEGGHGVSVVTLR
jgi:DNA mismatch repair protein MutS2